MTQTEQTLEILEAVKAFLIWAKPKAWAGNAKKIKSKDGGIEIPITNAHFSYQDIYHEPAENRYMGREIVWWKPENKIVWIMQYNGRIMPTEEITAKQIIEFQKEALRYPDTRLPCRGFPVCVKPPLIYDLEFNKKDICDFQALETINYKKEKLLSYTFCQGGVFV